MCWTWPLNWLRRIPEVPAGAGLWLTLAVLVCYVNALGGEFQFDDYKVIVDNPSVHSWDAWRNTAGQGALGIRPLLKLSYVLNWSSGWDVVGFHLVNVFIHLANTGLVYRLTQAFLREMPAQAGWSQVPLWSALLFAVHPANTEAVTYVCGRSTSLMALFYLAAVAVYASARIDDNQRKLHLAVPMLFLLALAVKETAVTLVLALLVWEIALGTAWQRIWQRQWSSGLMLLAGSAFFLCNDNYLAHLQRSAEFNSLAGNLATQTLGFGYLMRQWAWPVWLNIDPDLAVLPDLNGSAPHLLALFAVWLVAVAARPKRPWISFALGWALVHLVPLYVVLPRLDVANDRQLYLAGWPLALALVAQLGVWWKRHAVFWVLLLLVFGLSCLTVARNQDYRTEIALWEVTAKRSPNKARVHNNLGYAYQLAGRLDAARLAYTSALRLDPGHAKARSNLERLDLPD